MSGETALPRVVPDLADSYRYDPPPASDEAVSSDDLRRLLKLVMEKGDLADAQAFSRYSAGLLREAGK
jgi:hypothetical protein